jgi:hypothetical protein
MVGEEKFVIAMFVWRNDAEEYVSKTFEVASDAEIKAIPVADIHEYIY